MPGAVGQRSERDALFDVYAKNLHAHFPEYEGMFACPLCGRLFPRDAIDSGDVTIEHIIPKSIGGKLETLTCRSCNSRAGTEPDAPIVQRLRVEDTLSGEGDAPLRITFTVGVGETFADIYFSTHGTTPTKVHGIRRLFHRARHRQAPKALYSGTQVFSLHANLGYKSQRSHVALVRSAYLMLFRYFGYGYIKYSMANEVRGQIGNPDEQSEVMRGVTRLDSRPEIPNGVAILTNPRDLRCFFVFLDFSRETENYFGVAMPGLDEHADALYTRLGAWTDRFGKTLDAELVPVPFIPELLTNPGLKDQPVRIWNRLTARRHRVISRA